MTHYRGKTITSIISHNILLKLFPQQSPKTVIVNILLLMVLVVVEK